MSRVLAVANQNAGVGKTTTTINLAASLALAAQRVLLVDVDPQGNLTSGVGQKGKNAAGGTIYNALTSPEPTIDARPFLLSTGVDRMQLIPADRSLTGAEIELVGLPRREERLRTLLASVRDEFDYIFIDCPPSLGLLTLNALVAGDEMLIPIQAEYYALEGLGQLLETVEMVKKHLNPDLVVSTILLTMYDARTRLAEQVETEVREHFGPKVYKTVVPRTVRLAEAPSFGQPVIVFDPTSRGASAYRDLAKEVSGGATRRSG